MSIITAFIKRPANKFAPKAYQSMAETFSAALNFLEAISKMIVCIKSPVMPADLRFVHPAFLAGLSAGLSGHPVFKTPDYPDYCK